MFELRDKAPGANSTPKVEMVTTSVALTKKRLYLFPLRVPFNCKFSQYDWDFALTVAVGTTISYKAALFRRNGKLSDAVSSVQQVNTAVSVTGQATAFQTTAVGTTINLLPGDYFIGFIFDVVGAGAATLTAKNCHAVSTWVTGDYCYEDQGSFALPASTGALSYIHAASQNPFWCAVTYIGDVIP